MIIHAIININLGDFGDWDADVKYHYIPKNFEEAAYVEITSVKVGKNNVELVSLLTEKVRQQIEEEVLA